MRKLRALWSGELPLGEAFWTFAIGLAVLVNLSATVLFLAMVSIDRPWPELLAAFFLPVPYNIVAGVGVWRSAAHYQGKALHATLARIVALVTLVALSLV
jgi:hypothetical protein